jgi:hypothetical protein
MTITNILILQIIAHLLADFTFQNDKMATDKLENGFRSKDLNRHILIVFILSWVLSLQLKFVMVSAGIALLHWLIDGFKPEFVKNKGIETRIFFIDQVLHIMAISGCVLLFNYLFNNNSNFQTSSETYSLLIIFGFLVCTKPANIIIREVLRLYEISCVEKIGILNAGSLIGIIERILTLTLILIGQFGAVGFILAGKSILRYKDGDTKRMEYVLIGTLLSFGIAIMLGICLTSVKTLFFKGQMECPFYHFRLG